jgi:hypothetical protein
VRKVLIGLVPVVLLAAVSGVALGTIPAPDSVIHACYVKKTGALRVVSSNRRCPAGQAPLNWNARGPQGPQGPGEHLLNLGSNGTNGSFVFLRKVEGYVFKAFCNVTTSTDATAKLHYIVPSGVTTSEAGSVISSTSAPYAFHVASFSGDTNLTELTTTTSVSDTLDYTIVGSNGRSVQLYVTVAADNNATAPNSHCYVMGTVTPIS